MAGRRAHQQQPRQPGRGAPLHHWALAADEPRDSFGYRLYASHTLRLIDSAAGLAVTNPPQGQQMIDIDGIMVPDEGCARPGAATFADQPAVPAHRA